MYFIELDKDRLLSFIKEVINLLEKSSTSEIEVEEEDVRVILRKRSSHSSPPSPSIPTSIITRDIAKEEEKPSFSDNVYILRAPMTGVFYRAPSPNAPPFVEEGDIVRKGQRIALLEAMKIFNDVNAEVTGKIVGILAKNASIVQEGDPLFAIEPMEDVL